MGLTTHQFNRLDQPEFIRLIGPVYEHSPWVAAAAWTRRPFADVAVLQQALREAVAGAGEAAQLELIRAHPDLVGRAALAGTLTPASASEQADAGLDQLTSAEIALFQQRNTAYRDKFGFPFVICARLNKKATILSAFERRLPNSPPEEIEAALQEIHKIAGFRLNDLITADL